MRLQILSDLHLEIERTGTELYTYEVPVMAPNLALLGDIRCTIDGRLFKWIEVQLRVFTTVFFVPENHGEI